MKYKRLLLFVTSMIFISAFIICLFALFKTAEIYIDVTSVANSNENIEEKVKSVCDKKQGENLLFLSIEDLESQLNSQSGYLKVVKIEKEFPNKLHVKVEERVEKFAFYYGDSYYMLDEEMHILAKKATNENNIDKNKNILLNFSIADIDETSISVGKNLNIYDKTTLTYVNETFNKLFLRRGDISSVSVTVKMDKHFFRRLTLTMREGMVINIDKANERTSEKIDKALEFYDNSSNKGDTLEYYVNVLIGTGEINVGL